MHRIGDSKLACDDAVRQAGTRRLYQVNREAVARLRAEFGAFWDDRIDRLKAAAERAEKLKRKER